ncbi:MAG TPA: hypothetical protein VFW22_07900 [Pseudolabrys sp.]|nr:hypothetical protein [Pseudolabrys sp.]
MGDASQLQLSPYALFDPSQWANPYSNYQRSGLPGASYAGVPYNAMGQPIQPTPGMTINQTAAAAPQASASSPNMSQGVYSMYGGAAPGLPTGQGAPLSQFAGGNYGSQNMNDAAGLAALMGLDPSRLNGFQGRQQASPAPPASGGASTALTPQQYMAMRANPGPVGQYGATVPQSQSSAQPGSGVLQSFLQNWKPASSGAGAGFQQGFSAALKGMGYT